MAKWQETIEDLATEIRQARRQRELDAADRIRIKIYAEEVKRSIDNLLAAIGEVE